MNLASAIFINTLKFVIKGLIDGAYKSRILQMQLVAFKLAIANVSTVFPVVHLK